MPTTAASTLNGIHLFLLCFGGGAGLVLLGWWLAGMRLRYLWAAVVAVAVGSVLLFLLSYRDDHCDDYIACRLFMEPSAWAVLAVVPGMAVGLFIATVIRAVRSS